MQKPSDDVDNGGTDDEDDDTDDEQMNDTKIKELKSRKENGTEKHNDEEVIQSDIHVCTQSLSQLIIINILYGLISLYDCFPWQRWK